jgi:two-component system NtrC family sensor kinase
VVSHFNADQVESPFVEVGSRHGHAYFRQLRSKLIWMLLIVFITPLLMLSAYFHFQYSATLRKGIDNHLSSIAENQRNTVDLFLQERVANLRNAFHPDDLSVLSHETEIKKRLAELRRESPTFVDLGLFRPDGALISYAGQFPSLVGKNYSQEPWFQDLINRDRGYVISDVYLGFRGKPHFIVAVRQNTNGRLWTLRASVDPEKFGDFVGSSCLIKEAEAFIVNRQGQHQTFFAKDGHVQQTSIAPKKTSDTQVEEIEFSDSKYLRAVAWLTENDWALVVRVPKADAYAPIRHARIVIVAVMTAALIFTVFLVLSITRRLINRLEEADISKEKLRRQLFNAAKLAS